MASYVDTVAEAIIRQLKEGTAPWQRPWRPGARYVPYNPTTDKAYRGMNALWLMSQGMEQGYSDQRWLTYRQAEKEGAHVRRGEKGMVVQYWKWQDKEAAPETQGQPVLGSDGKPTHTKVAHERPQVFSAVVFNAEQIEGLAPLPEPEAAPAWEKNARAEAILKNSGASIRHEEGDRAFYRVTTDLIVLPTRKRFATADAYYATSLHELGHWSGHPTRLARDLAHPFGSEGYAREELRAEIASMMLGDELAIGHDPSQHVAYVKSWIKVLEQDHREIFRAASAAEKIKGYLMQYQLEQTQEHTQAEKTREGAVDESVPLQTDRSAVSMQGVGLDVAADIAKETQPAQSTTREYLSVPYREKEEAKRAGARWDKAAKSWYAPDGVALEGLERWMLAAPKQDAASESPQEEFARALKAAGLKVEGLPLMDGTLRRVPVEGDQGYKRSEAYVGFLNGHPAGYLNNFKTGLEMNWKSQVPVAAVTDALREQLRQEAEAAQSVRELARVQIQTAAAARAVAALEAAPLAPSDHPYLVMKGIEGNFHDLGVDPYGNLLIPAQDVLGRITSLQRIGPEGQKSFMKGGRIEGSHALLGASWLTERGVLFVAEGYATAAAIERSLDYPIVAAFSAGNLLPVAQGYREKYPKLTIIIAGDNDHQKPLETGVDGRPKINVGKEKAEAAAQQVRGYALLPPFRPGDGGSDWNDYKKLYGPEETARILREGIAVGQVYTRALRSREVVPRMALADLKLSPEEARLRDERLLDADERRLQDAHRTRHDGETVAETLMLHESTVETPDLRASLDQLKGAAEKEAITQSQKRSLGRARRL